MNNKELLAVIKNQHDYDVTDRQKGEQRIMDAIENHETRIAALEKLGNLVAGAVIILGGLVGAAWAAIIAWIGAGGMNDIQHFKK